MKLLNSIIKSIFAVFIWGFFSNVNAQTGYIYVQKKALDETSSIDFPFAVSGGPTAVPNFSLNDKDDQVPLQDIGASQSGRLWAVGTNNTLYYRDLGSSTWVATSVTDAYRVDGGPGNTCYYIRTTSDPYSFDGVTSTLLGNWVSFGNSPSKDIGSAWDNKPYITTNSGAIWQYSGIGTIWLQVGTSTDNSFVDGNPTNGNAVVTKTDNTIWNITSLGLGTSLGAPAGTGAAKDVAVASDGSVFASYNVTSLYSNDYAFKWISGTVWSSYEITSRSYTDALTAGLGGQVWGLYTGSGASPVNRNIFTRTYDGTTTLWLNDERVRTTAKGNSQMIAVAPGTYTITELVPTGWDLQRINVYDPTNNSSTSVVGNTATVTVADGETVTALFENSLVKPFAMTNSCASPYTENFGTGAVGTYGLPLVGQTPYHYQTTGNTLANDYKIVGNANMLYGGAATLTDHTTGDGLGMMMAIDANNEQDAFFRRRFTGIIPGATYNFSAWIANINAGANIKPNVTFDVIDPTTYAVLQTVNTGDITSNAVWTKYGITFTATTTTFDLVIRNNGFGGSGNDLVIDDISFSLLPVSTPITTVVSTGCGTLGSITVTNPVGTNYEYSIDNFATAPHASPVFANLSAGTYTVSARFVGTINCFSSKTDLVGTTICGNIWDDANGNAINNGENPVTGGVWINLVDPSTHAVLQSVPVDASGNYSFTGLAQNSGFQVILSNADQTGNNNLTAASLPVNYTATGTNLGNTANTGNTTGIITVNTGASGLTGQNFGIEQLPITNAVTQVVPPPILGIILAGKATIAVSGTDAEDGPLGNSNKFIVTSLPTNAIMLYNGVAVTVGLPIIGFNVSLVSFTGITLESTSVVFSYAFIDAAGKQSATPATYTLSWSQPLPITLTDFTAVKENDNVRLSWSSLTEQNLSKFLLEHSIDQQTFTTIATVAATGNSSIPVNYTWLHNNPDAGNNYYRLKMVDNDNKYSYSPVQTVLFPNLNKQIVAYPNPVINTTVISGITIGNTVRLIDVMGKIISKQTSVGNTVTIRLSNCPSGIYLVEVLDKGMLTAKIKLVKE